MSKRTWLDRVRKLRDLGASRRDNGERAGSTGWSGLEGLESRMLLSLTLTGVDLNPPVVQATSITGNIVDATPDPRNTPVNSVSIVFSEAVENFGLGDLVLRRGATDIDISGAGLTSADDTTWTLDLTGLTGTDGVYTLTLVDRDAAITTKTTHVNTLKNEVVADSWTMDTAVPTAVIRAIEPSIRTSAIDSITLVFSRPITGLNLADLSLTRGDQNGENMEPVDLADIGAEVTQVNDTTWTLSNLADQTGVAGTYVVKLTAAGSEIKDSVGNELAADATQTWTVSASTVAKVSIFTDVASATEAGTSGRIVVARSGGDMTKALVVKLNIRGSAINGKDYAAVAKTVTIPANGRSTVIAITPTDDATPEATENVLVAILPDKGYIIDKATPSATLTIADASPQVSIIANTPTATEGGSAGQFTISRAVATAEALTVNITIKGTAKNGTHYTYINKTVTIPAGQTSKTVDVATINNGKIDPDLTVTMTVAKGKTYAVDASRASATVNLVDSGPHVSITADKTRVGEDAVVITYTVTRTGATTSKLEVPISIKGTAGNGKDYTTAVAKIVTIPANSASTTFTITSKNNSKIGPDKTLLVSLVAGKTYVLGAARTAAVTIVDNGPHVSIAATDAVATEAGNNPGQFTVTRTGSTAAALVVNVTFKGTAKNGRDYTLIAKTVTIPAGSATATIALTPTANTVDQGPRTIIAQVAASALYVVDPIASLATVTILAD